eukprot:201954-Chlamydomonas_euryale.AAC.4
MVVGGGHHHRTSWHLRRPCRRGGRCRSGARRRPRRVARAGGEACPVRAHAGPSLSLGGGRCEELGVGLAVAAAAAFSAATAAATAA